MRGRMLLISAAPMGGVRDVKKIKGYLFGATCAAILGFFLTIPDFRIFKGAVLSAFIFYTCLWLPFFLIFSFIASLIPFWIFYALKKDKFFDCILFGTITSLLADAFFCGTWLRNG